MIYKGIFNFRTKNFKKSDEVKKNKKILKNN